MRPINITLNGVSQLVGTATLVLISKESDIYYWNGLVSTMFIPSWEITLVLHPTNTRTNEIQMLQITVATVF